MYAHDEVSLHKLEVYYEVVTTSHMDCKPKDTPNYVALEQVNFESEMWLAIGADCPYA